MSSPRKTGFCTPVEITEKKEIALEPFNTQKVVIAQATKSTFSVDKPSTSSTTKPALCTPAEIPDSASLKVDSYKIDTKLIRLSYFGSKNKLNDMYYVNWNSNNVTAIKPIYNFFSDVVKLYV